MHKIIVHDWIAHGAIGVLKSVLHQIRLGVANPLRCSPNSCSLSLSQTGSPISSREESHEDGTDHALGQRICQHYPRRDVNAMPRTSADSILSETEDADAMILIEDQKRIR